MLLSQKSQIPNCDLLFQSTAASTVTAAWTSPLRWPSIVPSQQLQGSRSSGPPRAEVGPPEYCLSAFTLATEFSNPNPWK